jgi:hypothetical protein
LSDKLKAPEKRAISSKFLHRFVPHLHVYQSNDVLKKEDHERACTSKAKKENRRVARPKTKQKTRIRVGPCAMHSSRERDVNIL